MATSALRVKPATSRSIMAVSTTTSSSAIQMGA